MEEFSSFPLDYAMHCYNSCNTQVPHTPSIVLPTQVRLQVSGEKSSVAVILKQLWEIRIFTIKISGLETFVTYVQQLLLLAILKQESQLLREKALAESNCWIIVFSLMG